MPDIKTYSVKFKKRPHVVWKQVHRQTYLEEMMRCEGRGDFLHSKECPDCKIRRIPVPELPEYRCCECMLPDLVCAPCCVKRHRTNPFHRIEVWFSYSLTCVRILIPSTVLDWLSIYQDVAQVNWAGRPTQSLRNSLRESSCCS